MHSLKLLFTELNFKKSSCSILLFFFFFYWTCTHGIFCFLAMATNRSDGIYVHWQYMCRVGRCCHELSFTRILPTDIGVIVCFSVTEYIKSWQCKHISFITFTYDVPKYNMCPILCVFNLFFRCAILLEVLHQIFATFCIFVLFLLRSALGNSNLKKKFHQKVTIFKEDVGVQG